MRVDDGVLKTVVYIGRSVASEFVPYGSGFVVASLVDGFKFQTIVTAKHVLEKMGEIDVVLVRVNQRGGVARELPLRRTDWLAHPDPNVDLIVCPTVIQQPS
jgi:hypothetical protein